MIVLLSEVVIMTLGIVGFALYSMAVDRVRPGILDRQEQTLLRVGQTICLSMFVSASVLLLSGADWSLSVKYIVIAVGILVAVFLSIAPQFRSGEVENSGESDTSERLVRILVLIAYPIAYPLTHILHGVIRVGENPLLPRDKDEDSADKKESLIEEGERDGIFAEDEGDLLHSVVDFVDTIVREVMTPRTEITALRLDDSIESIIEVMTHGGHSRVPVYQERVDEIKGILVGRDLYRNWDAFQSGDIRLEKLLRKPYFVPETKKVKDLIKEFQTQKIQMAIVVDEYGGTAGLVTIEDLVEVIFGDIQDEYDNESQLMTVIDSDTIQVFAKLEVDEIEDFFDVELDRDDFETVGGLVFHYLERIPSQGEEFETQGLKFTVLTADERRIHAVRIERIHKLKEAEDDGGATDGTDE